MYCCTSMYVFHRRFWQDHRLTLKTQVMPTRRTDLREECAVPSLNHSLAHYSLSSTFDFILQPPFHLSTSLNMVDGQSDTQEPGKALTLPPEVWAIVLNHLRRPTPPPTGKNERSSIRQPDLAVTMRVNQVCVGFLSWAGRLSCSIAMEKGR